MLYVPTPTSTAGRPHWICWKNGSAFASTCCPLTNSSRFLFVPGPGDPGPGTILPRWVCYAATHWRVVDNCRLICLPQTSSGQSHHRGVQTAGALFCLHHEPMQVDQQAATGSQNFTGFSGFRKLKWFGFFLFFFSFCRVQYCSQEIIIFREDLVNKMCRNCVRLPNDNLDIPNHVSFSCSEQTFILVRNFSFCVPLFHVWFSLSLFSHFLSSLWKPSYPRVIWLLCLSMSVPCTGHTTTPYVSTQFQTSSSLQINMTLSASQAPTASVLTR